MRERNNKLLRFFDYFFGIPLIFLLGLIKKISDKVNKKVIDLKSIKRIKRPKIAILKEAAIGDLVLLTGILKDIESNFPEAKVFLICSESNHEITALFDTKVDLKVLVFPFSKFFKLMKMVFALPAFDIWMDFGQWPRINALITFFVRAKLKAGFRTKGQFRHYVYDLVVDHSSFKHELDNFREFLIKLDLNTGNMPYLKVIEKEINLPEKFVILHIFPGGSRANLKSWHRNNWAMLGKYLLENGFKIILTGLKKDFPSAEVLKWQLEHFGYNGSFVMNKAGEWNLEETVFAISKANCVVSVDTSIVHIASALGANLVALYGPTTPERWGPLNKNSVAVKASVDCGPCLSLGFESKCLHNRCMELIKVEDVIEKIKVFFNL
jgi:heptosyltransferase I